MTYSIRVNDITKKFFDCDDGRHWVNITVRAILNDDDALVALYEGAGYDYNGHPDLDHEDKAHFIRKSNEIHKLLYVFDPVVNYVHVLQQKPTDEEVLEIYEKLPDIVVIEDDMGNFFLSFSCSGVDMSEELAYAYMIIDRCVPSSIKINTNKNYTLSEEEHKELVDFMNKKRKK